MMSFSPPNFSEFAFTLSLYFAIFNSVCLAAVVVCWRLSDRRHLRTQRPDSVHASPAERRVLMAKLRESHFYFESLPPFVSDSLLRFCTGRTSAPSLGPVLVVALAQSLPFVSIFVATWYAMHAVGHAYRSALRLARCHTPALVKRLLFTQWF